MEKPVMILGAKGMGPVALDIFNSRNIMVYCFLDDDETLKGTVIEEVSVLGKTTDDGFLKFIGQKCEAFVAIEDTADRKKLVKLLNTRRKVMPVNAIHDEASVSMYAVLGHGLLLNAGCRVGAGAKVGNHSILHTGTIVEHGAELGEYVQLGVGASVGAGAILADEVLVGAGAMIAGGVKIGKGAQIGPASLVLQSVEANAVVFGVPAKAV